MGWAWDADTEISGRNVVGEKAEMACIEWRVNAEVVATGSCCFFGHGVELASSLTN